MEDNLCCFIGPKLWWFLFIFWAVSKVVVSQSIVKAVPGFTGDLPFKLETGYIGVGELDEVANIIFLDAPAGTGFSYATTWQSYNVSDTISAAHNSEFLRKWLLAHPNFLANQLYVAGVSYPGIYVPLVVQDIVVGTEAGHSPPINLQSAKRDCKGQYVDVDPSNALCLKDLEAFQECTAKIQMDQILEPSCTSSYSPKPSILEQNMSSLIEDSNNALHSEIHLPTLWCRNDYLVYASIWLNDQSVRKALHIREGTIKNWVRCNSTWGNFSYRRDVFSSVDIHRNLINKVRRVMIFSGDKDMVFPYLGTLWWIQSLNLTIENDWGPWFVDGQVAGYTMQFSDDYYYHLTFATIKGGGHTGAEYRPKEYLAMVDRWFANYPL